MKKRRNESVRSHTSLWWKLIWAAAGWIIEGDGWVTIWPGVMYFNYVSTTEQWGLSLAARWPSQPAGSNTSSQQSRLRLIWCSCFSPQQFGPVITSKQLMEISLNKPVWSLFMMSLESRRKLDLHKSQDSKDLQLESWLRTFYCECLGCKRHTKDPNCVSLWLQGGKKTTYDLSNTVCSPGFTLWISLTVKLIARARASFPFTMNAQRLHQSVYTQNTYCAKWLVFF